LCKLSVSSERAGPVTGTIEMKILADFVRVDGAMARRELFVIRSSKAAFATRHAKAAGTVAPFAITGDDQFTRCLASAMFACPDFDLAVQSS